MIIYLLWNNYDSSDLIHLFLLLHVYITFARLSIKLEAKKVCLLLCSEPCGHFRASSGNQFYSHQLLASRELFCRCKHLFSACALSSVHTMWTLNHSIGWSCMTDFLLQKAWFSFLIYWEILGKDRSKKWWEGKAWVCNLYFMYGEILIQAISNKNTFVNY